MTLEPGPGHELLAAVTTEELLLPPLVNHLIMFQKSLLSLEPLPAAWSVAYEGEDVRVSDEMTGQVRLLVEHFVALRTWEVILGVGL